MSLVPRRLLCGPPSRMHGSYPVFALEVALYDKERREWDEAPADEQAAFIDDVAALVAVAGEMRNALSRARAILVRLNTPLESDERAVVRELDRLLAATRPG